MLLPGKRFPYFVQCTQSLQVNTCCAMDSVVRALVDIYNGCRIVCAICLNLASEFLVAVAERISAGLTRSVRPKGIHVQVSTNRDLSYLRLRNYCTGSVVQANDTRKEKLCCADCGVELSTSIDSVQNSDMIRQARCNKLSVFSCYKVSVCLSRSMHTLQLVDT